MNCPYCQNPTKKGEVQSMTGGRIFWQPEEATKGVNKMRFSIRSVKNHGGIILSRHQMNVISKPLIGYCCPKCKKIIIEYDDESPRKPLYYRGGTFINCSYCQNPTKKGEVQSMTGGRIFWQPEEATKGVNKMRFFVHSVKNHGGIILSRHQMNVISKPLIGFCCPECKKIIIEYQDERPRKPRYYRT